MAAFILGELGRPVLFPDYVLEWPDFFFSLDAAERAPFMKYAGPAFEQFIRRAASKLRDESRTNPRNCGDGRYRYHILCKLERVALYLLRPDAGLVVPAPTPTPT